MRVRELMVKNPVCCLAESSTLDAAWLMKAHNYGCLPVVRGQTTRKLVGMVTDRDLAMAVLPKGLTPGMVLVSAAMTRLPVTCGPDDTIEACAQLMRDYKVRRVPVVDEHGACIGLVSQSDLVKVCDPALFQQTVRDCNGPRPVTEAEMA